MNHMTDIEGAIVGVRHPAHGSVCSAEAPFARLRLGNNAYEIAHALHEDSLLAFRPEGSQTWTALDCGIADGWHQIGADIVTTDPDALFNFFQTHAVSVETTGDLVKFDTLGTVWAAKLQDEEHVAISFDNGPWEVIRLGRKTEGGYRERSILGLLAASVDAAGHFGDDLRRWAQRIAAGLTVEPIM